MANTDVKLTFQADIGDLREKLSKNANLTKEEVRSMIAAISKAHAASEKNAKKVADSWSTAAKKSASAVGGAAKDIAGSMAVAGGAAALMGAAVIKAGVEGAKALADLIHFAQDTADRFEEIGLTKVYTAQQSANIQRASDELEALGLGAGEAAGKLVSLLSPALHDVAGYALTAFLSFSKLFGEIETGAVTFGSFGDMIKFGVSAPILQAIIDLSDLAEAMGISTQASKKHRVEVWATLEALRAKTVIHHKDTAAQIASTEENANGFVALEKYVSALQGARTALEDSSEAKRDDAEATDEVSEALKRQKAILSKTVGSGRLAMVAAADAAEAADKWDAAIEAGKAASAAVEQEWADAEKAQKEATTEMIMNVAGLIQQVQGLADVYDIFANRAIDAHADAIDGIEGQIKKERERYKEAKGEDKARSKARIENLKREKEAHEKAQMSAWKAQRAVAITNSIIATALAVITTLAQLGATPWGIAASVAAGVMGAAATVAIATEPPPKFHTGKSPVEMPAMLDRQEAVLNRRAVSDLGSETIARANQGILGGNGGGGVMQTAIYLNDRILDTITANGIMRGSQSRLAVAAVARSANYRGGYK